MEETKMIRIALVTVFIGMFFLMYFVAYFDDPGAVVAPGVERVRVTGEVVAVNGSWITLSTTQNVFVKENVSLVPGTWVFIEGSVFGKNVGADRIEVLPGP